VSPIASSAGSGRTVVWRAAGARTFTPGGVGPSFNFNASLSDALAHTLGAPTGLGHEFADRSTFGGSRHCGKHHHSAGRLTRVGI
jgi:hypothetical protein